MIKNRTRLLIVFALLFNINMHAQLANQRYVIITFEDSYKISFEGKKIYSWIVPQDSINSSDFQLAFLFLSKLSTKDIFDCKSNKPIDPGTNFKEPNDTIDIQNEKQCEKLKSIIERKKRKVFSILKKWETGQSEKIDVFVTPIIGEFCFADFHFLGKMATKYDGRVSILSGNFKFDDAFWKERKATYVLHKDFSGFRFDIIPY